ncbi:MAG: hypothetical protein HKO99_09350 [Xanthomonadales bacterium]|nr:hypothetical protein [Gammaproteobacteria bacterium]NNK51786.1 hypothetical protein [Xanthomonadales bacterium]
MRILIILTLLLCLIAEELFAEFFRDGGWHAENGVLESISIDPALPQPGSGFTVVLSGSWPEKSPDSYCIEAPVIDRVTVYPGNRVQMISNLKRGPEICDQPPATWNIEVPIPATAWEAVDENGFLRIEHLMSSGINMLTGISRVIDTRLGTHEVPAFIGAGFWISGERPFEGVLVEQQGTRVLFYGLEYDRNESLADDGEPVWRMISGDMSGNSVLGRVYRFDWPVDGGFLPGQAPDLDELHTVNDSGAIIVEDYNHLRILTGVLGNLGLYSDYTRLEFGLDPSRLPVYVPPLAGRWMLYGFEGRDAALEAPLELLQGYSSAVNQFRFDSVDGDWQVQCTVIPPGDGSCHIERAADGTRFEFLLSAFQGNLARGILQPEDQSPLDGVLVRDPWRLPVVVTGSTGQ